MLQAVDATETQTTQILLRGAVLGTQELSWFDGVADPEARQSWVKIGIPWLGYRPAQVTAPGSTGFFLGKREWVSREKWQVMVQFQPINIIQKENENPHRSISKNQVSECRECE